MLLGKWKNSPTSFIVTPWGCLEHAGKESPWKRLNWSEAKYQYPIFLMGYVKGKENKLKYKTSVIFFSFSSFSHQPNRLGFSVWFTKSSLEILIMTLGTQKVSFRTVCSFQIQFNVQIGWRTWWVWPRRQCRGKKKKTQLISVPVSWEKQKQLILQEKQFIDNFNLIMFGWRENTGK